MKSLSEIIMLGLGRFCILYVCSCSSTISMHICSLAIQYNFHCLIICRWFLVHSLKKTLIVLQNWWLILKTNLKGSAQQSSDINSASSNIWTWHLIANLMRNRRKTRFFPLQLMFPHRQHGGTWSGACSSTMYLKRGYGTNLLKMKWTNAPPILWGAPENNPPRAMLLGEWGEGMWDQSTLNREESSGVSSSSHGMRSWLTPYPWLWRLRQQARYVLLGTHET